MTDYLKRKYTTGAYFAFNIADIARLRKGLFMIDDYKLDELKSGLVSYVQSITEPDRRAGRGMYKCPLCGSGSQSGGRHNGAFSITKDGKAWKCFSCNQGGDIFTLISLHEGLTEFKDQAERAAELTGVNMFTEFTQETEKTKKTKETEITKNTEKYKGYIAACRAAVGRTDYFKSRGFTEETIERFELGYDAEKKAVVIPYGRNGGYYITRSTEGKEFRKPKSSEAGAEPIYNGGALNGSKPCFVCESPIDAISIMQAGGDYCTAIALGGTGSQKLIDRVKKQAPSCMLILSFDADDAGQKATERTAEDLTAANIPYLIANYNLEAYPEGQRKDANDFLKGNIAQLTADIKENVEEIERRANAEKAAALEAHNAFNGAELLKGFVGGIKDSVNTVYIPTGFSELDKELDGGLYPGLYILGAISSLGKTTLLLQLADQIAAQGTDVLYFSLEMAASELISKSISRQTLKLCDGKKGNAKTARGITTASRYQSYSQEEKELINKAIEAYGSYAGNLYLYEGVGDIGIEQVRQKVAEHKELTGRTAVVFIDYLQILAPYDMRASDKQNTDKAVLELKRISRDYKTPVIGISSFNRDNYTSEVNMTAFKESGAIEYGSDVLLALQPQGMKAGYTATDQKANADLVKKCKASEERSIEAVILKNRNGRTGGKVGFTYYSLFNCFEQDYGFRAIYDDDETPFTDNEDSGLRI